MKLGIAGHLTRAFIGSALTPLFLLAAFAVGLVALVTLPARGRAADFGADGGYSRVGPRPQARKTPKS